MSTKTTDEWKVNSKQDVFINMLLAAMKDAVSELALTQLKATIEHNGKIKHCRIIIVPEQMEREFPQGLGSD